MNTALSFYGGVVHLVFEEVVSAGHTICEKVGSPGGVDPSFIPVTPYYWISTSARFSGFASITVQYDEDDVPPGKERDLKLYRVTEEWSVEDVTKKPNQMANTVTGQTDTFPFLFVVGYMNAAPEPQILSPNTGDVVAGQSCTIRWEATDPDAPASSLSIDLFYSTDGGTTWQPIVSGTENDGFYEWDIGSLSGGMYMLKLVAKDPEGGTSEATTGPFTIVVFAGTVIVAPNPVSDTGTTFFYTLPAGTTSAKLMIFSAFGQLIFETQLDVSSTRFPSTGTWSPVDRFGAPLANGPYIYVLVADGKVIGQGKMVIQR